MLLPNLLYLSKCVVSIGRTGVSLMVNGEMVYSMAKASTPMLKARSAKVSGRTVADSVRKNKHNERTPLLEKIVRLNMLNTIRPALLARVESFFILRL